MAETRESGGLTNTWISVEYEEHERRLVLVAMSTSTKAGQNIWQELANIVSLSVLCCCYFFSQIRTCS